MAATVLASRGWQAEVLAKVALVAGITAGLDLVTSLGGDAMIVDDGGWTHRTPGFDRFSVTCPPPGATPADPHLEAAR